MIRRSIARAASSLVARPVNGAMESNFNQLIKSLFANNEQGFAYDPNDLTTMFQDAMGTIPVTAVGQPAGLVLDKSKGMVLGSELFDDSKVILQGAVRLEKGLYRIQSEGPLAFVRPYTDPYSVNKRLRVEYEITEIVGGSIRADVTLGGSTSVPIGTTIGKYVTYIYGISLAFTRQITPTDVSIRILSIKEVLGNHAYQTNAASRPILQRNATTGAYYLEFDGSDDFLQTNNIDFTSTDKVSVFAGVRKLRDANRATIIELSSLGGGSVGSFSIEAPRSIEPISSYASATKGTLVSVAGAPKEQYSSPSSVVLSAKFSISTNTNKLVVNGSTFASSESQGTGNYGNYPIYIGRRGGTTLPFNGHLYSLIGIGRLTTDAETVALEKLIAKNTGVALSV